MGCRRRVGPGLNRRLRYIRRWPCASGRRCGNDRALSTGTVRHAGIAKTHFRGTFWHGPTQPDTPRKQLGTDAEVLDTAKAATRKVRAKLSATEVEEIAARAAGYAPRRPPSLGDHSPKGARPSDPVQEQPRPGRGPPAPDLPAGPLPPPAASPTRQSGPVQPPAPPRRFGPRLSELIDLVHPRDRDRGKAEGEQPTERPHKEEPTGPLKQPRAKLSKLPREPGQAVEPPTVAPEPAAAGRVQETSEPERDPRTVEELARRAHHELGMTLDEITAALRNTRDDLAQPTTVGLLWRTLVIRHEAQTNRRTEPWFVAPEDPEHEGPELPGL